MPRLNCKKAATKRPANVIVIRPNTIPDKSVSTIIKQKFFYLNPTLACQTKASKKNKTGIIGKISAKGPKIANIPGNLLNKILSIIKNKIFEKKISIFLLL